MCVGPTIRHGHRRLCRLTCRTVCTDVAQQVWGGKGAVVWNDHKPEFPYSNGLVPVICSWFVSPVTAGKYALSQTPRVRCTLRLGVLGRVARLQYGAP